MMPPIASHSTATTDVAWDGSAMRTNLRNDGTASYYRTAFAWADPEGDPETKTAYRFIHHMVAAGDGRVGAANTVACSAGIAVLNGGRGGTTIPAGDRQGVYNHLARHLRDADREPPELASYEEVLERMSRESVLIYKCCQLEEVKTEEDGVFSGYASTYNRDLQGDQIMPGAFAQSIRDKRGKIPILNNHDDNEVIGFSTSLAEDGKGLMLTAKLAGSQAGQNAYALLKTAAAVDYRMGMSIGFIARDWDYDGDVRSIKEIDLWEASLTPFPAQPKAFVSAVKSTRALERLLRDVGCLSKSESRRAIRVLSTDLNQSSGGMLEDFPAITDRQNRWLRQLLGQSQWKESDAR